ncbi:MAG: exo-rhamnogalacturonan lyase family protein, partial [Planctomycetota bacterium]
MRLLIIIILSSVLTAAMSIAADNNSIIKKVTPVLWQQLDNKMSFTVFSEKEEFDSIDQTATVVLFLQTGKKGDSAAGFNSKVVISNGSKIVETVDVSLAKGMSSIVIDLSKLSYGKYNIKAELLNNGEEVAGGKAETFFRFVKTAKPAQSGKISIVFPKGIALDHGTVPLTTGLPFPRGALFNKENIKLVDSEGKDIPCQTIVRSRWGSSSEASIRWLGIDFQASNISNYWPTRKDKSFYVEYGKGIKNSIPASGIKVNQTEDGYLINNGKIVFKIRNDKFNLIDNVNFNGKEIYKGAETAGLYLIDHEGAVYRSANDKKVSVKIEEEGPLRTVLKVEGWYVKDGTAGEKLNWTLPTDKLCKFITRIETYANLPQIRILNTWVITYDSFSVRLKDVGIDFSINSANVNFATEDKGVFKSKVNNGLYLIQHLHNKYNIEDTTGKL